MARRGFFAEMQHQSQVAARQAQQRQRAAEASQRRAQQAAASAQRAQLAAQRASEADRKRLEREAALAHVASMQAQVDEKNEALAAEWDQLEHLLAATLAVDDFIDLETLRQIVEHPPFDRADLEVPTRPPIPVPEAAWPVRHDPEPVKGLIGKAKKIAAAQEAADADYAAAYAVWQRESAEIPIARERQAAEFALAEQNRLAALGEERARYAEECAQRETNVQKENAALDAMITGLSYGTVDAVNQYLDIVLANSVYPEHFTVDHMARFDPSTAELRLQVLVPPPGSISAVKSYKYTRATDEITATPLTQKETKDRYASVIHQVGLRTLHEIFEADRRSLIRSIALEVGTNTISPATGKDLYVPFVAVGVSREKFVEIDLSAIVPAATLTHLGASVSKSPFDLVAANAAGVRHS